MARGLEILAQLLNSGVREEKQTARKFMNLRAVRWTVGIDQEVVTLRGLSRQLSGQGLKHKTEVPGWRLRATNAMPPSVLTG